MTENNGSQPSHPPVPEGSWRQNERVGEILRREREQRRISIEDVAKKLRLNAKYIEAIESNQYDKLPGDTYIRVYLRSLSSFLSLNAEEIFRRFFEERGVTGVDTLRKDSSTKINIAAQEEKKTNTALIVTLAVIALLVIFSVIVNRQGCHSSHAGKHAKMAVDTANQGAGVAIVKDTGTQGRLAADTAAADSQRNESKPVRKEEKPGAETAPAKQMGDLHQRHSADTVQKANKVETKTAGRPIVDTVKPAQPAIKPAKDTVRKSAVSAKPPAKAADTARTAVKYQSQLTKEMVLRMTVTGDSCWGRVFSDGGKEWKNTVFSGKGVTFTAQDSFNVHVGVGGAVIFTLNGKPLQLPDKKGVMTFKIDRSGAVTLWPLEKWNSVFGGHF